MSAYNDIDPDLERWASANFLKWIYNFAGEDRRFLYITNAENETYQISIDVDDGGGIAVNLYSVERYDKDDVSLSWVATRANLERVLSVALDEAKDLGRKD